MHATQDNSQREWEPPQTSKEKLRFAMQGRFLVAYAELGEITSACKASGVGRTTAHEWLKLDSFGFKDRFKEAQDVHTDGIERIMWDRISTPTGNRGSDILLMFALKARRPDVFRELAAGVDDDAKDAIAELRRVGKLAREALPKASEKEQLTTIQQAETLVRSRGGKA